jgi:hypothetical protein
VGFSHCTLWFLVVVSLTLHWVVIWRGNLRK